jgi:hypothetical protein
MLAPWEYHCHALASPANCHHWLERRTCDSTDYPAVSEIENPKNVVLGNSAHQLPKCHTWSWVCFRKLYGMCCVPSNCLSCEHVYRQLSRVGVTQDPGVDRQRRQKKLCMRLCSHLAFPGLSAPRRLRFPRPLSSSALAAP